MQAIKTYPTQLEAELDRLALEKAGIPSVVVGAGITMQAGIQGVQLLVREELAERALRTLDR
jgi:hypothetical protein